MNAIMVAVGVVAGTLAYVAACLGMLGGGGALVMVQEGQVACTYTLGRLDDSILPPGNHFLAMPPPPIRHPVVLSIRSMTTVLDDAECSSSDGVAIPIPKLELVHQLAASGAISTVRAHGTKYTDFLVKQLRAEVVQLCSQWSLGDIVIHRYHEFDDVLEERLRSSITETAPALRVTVHQVRVARPQVPGQIGQAFSEVEQLKRKEEAESGRRDKLVKAAETERRRAVLKAEKEAEMSRMAASRLMERAQSKLQEQKVAINTMSSQLKAAADAEEALLQQQARSHQALLSPAYLSLARAQRLLAGSKLYLGGGVPRMMMIEDEGPSRSVQGGSSPASSSRSGGGNLTARADSNVWAEADLDGEVRALMGEHLVHGGEGAGEQAPTSSNSPRFEPPLWQDRQAEDSDEEEFDEEDFVRVNREEGGAASRGDAYVKDASSRGGAATTAMEVLQVAGQLVWAALDVAVLM